MYILIIILHMKLGGDVVTMQEFGSKATCIATAEYINKHIDNAELNCLPK